MVAKDGTTNLRRALLHPEVAARIQRSSVAAALPKQLYGMVLVCFSPLNWSGKW